MVLVILCDTVCCLGAGVIRTTHTSPHVKGILLNGDKFQYISAYMYNTLKTMLAMLDYIFDKTVKLRLLFETRVVFTICIHPPCEQSLFLSFSLLRRRKVGSARIASTL